VFLAHVGPMAVRSAREALARAAERAGAGEVRELLEAASREETAAPAGAPEPELLPDMAPGPEPAEVAATMPAEATDSVNVVEPVHIDAQTAEDERAESQPESERDGEAARPRREPLVNAVRAWIVRRTQYLGGRQN
jgi:hypothetical protein